jgi:uncharacterized protein YxjI
MCCALTIHTDETILQDQVEDLKEKIKGNEFVVKAKLQEKDEQIQTLMKMQEKFEQLIQTLIDSGQLKPN